MRYRLKSDAISHGLERAKTAATEATSNVVNFNRRIQAALIIPYDRSASLFVEQFSLDQHPPSVHPRSCSYPQRAICVASIIFERQHAGYRYTSLISHRHAASPSFHRDYSFLTLIVHSLTTVERLRYSILCDNTEG